MLALLYGILVSSLALALPVSPVPRDSEGWLSRHQANVAEAQASSASVVFYGDSITDLWRATGWRVWGERIAPLGAVNFGIGGDRIENVLWRIQNGETQTAHSPRWIVLLIGTNNLWEDSVEDIAQGHQKLVEELKRLNPESRILCLGIFPRAGEEYRVKIAPVNLRLSKLADESRVFYRDFGAPWADANGGVPPELFYDGVHLSEAAYQLWADALLLFLKDHPI